MSTRWFRPRRIRTRLVLTYVTPVLVLELVFALLFYTLARDSLEREMGRRLVAIAQSAATQLPIEGFLTLDPGDERSRNYLNLSRRLARLAELNGVARLFVFDAANRNLVDSSGTVPIGAAYHRLVADGLELERVRGGEGVASTLFQGPDGQGYKSGYAPLRYHDGVVAVLGVEAGVDFLSTLGDIRRSVMLLGGATVAILVGVSFLFARQIERPLEELVRNARRIGTGDLGAPIPVRTGDEIGFLAATMEEMRENVVDSHRNLTMLQRGIAHEVRNPLGGMLLFADLLLEDLEDPTQRGYVIRIRKELETLDRVVNSFLDYTRDRQPDIREVQLGPFLNDVLGLCPRGDPDSRVNLELDLDVPQSVARFDPDLMQGALLNLCTNAAQSMPEGGSVRVRATTDERYLRFEIADTGPGIDPAVGDEIFKPFFTTKASGSGLGLAFVKKVCELHGGDVEVTSDAGEGSLFTLRVPLSVEE